MKLDYEPTYKIRPLVWEKVYYQDIETYGFETHTIIGIFQIIVDEDDYSNIWNIWHSPDKVKQHRKVILKCCLPEDGKHMAEEFYLSKLKEALIKL